MTIEASLQKAKKAIVLKGGMFTLTSVQLLDPNLELISNQLDDKIKQAPNFFNFAPVILDLQKLTTEQIDFLSLIALCRAKKIIPVGIRGASVSQREEASIAGLAILPDEKRLESDNNTEDSNSLKHENTMDLNEPATACTQPNRSPTRIIRQPIRSGQQIYVPGGDLIVMSSVGHGAEVLADGNIHVHGALRGRALAGVMGDKNAMIYCKCLEAELVSIAGQYRISEDLKDNGWKNSVVIQLEDGKLSIKEI